MDHAEFVDRYGRAVEENRAGVVVGAGLSRGASYPDWDRLLKPLREELRVPAEFHDLPMLAQFVENTDGGRERLVRAVYQQLGAVEAVPTLNHHVLAALPVGDVWTTNYDPLIELASPEAEVIDSDESLVEARANVRRVYKMHGSVPPGQTEPGSGQDNLVLSRDDFDRYPQTHPRFWALLRAQFLTMSFLFVGYSLTDPNFQSVLQLVRTTTPKVHVDHFAVLKPKGDEGAVFDHRAEDLRRAGVNVVRIDSYERIPDLLQQLVARTRPSRLFIGGSLASGTEASLAPVDATGPYPAADELGPELEELAAIVGHKLARSGISVTTAGRLGAAVGYALIDSLDDYDADRLTVVRRYRSEAVTPPNRRLGKLEFTGTRPSEMRGQAFEQVRAVLVIGGGGGTVDETGRATEAGMGVVPLACSGGAALSVWEEMRSQLGEVMLGGRPIEPDLFEALRDPDLEVATDAAVALVKQAMYLSEPT